MPERVKPQELILASQDNVMVKVRMPPAIAAAAKARAARDGNSLSAFVRSALRRELEAV